MFNWDVFSVLLIQASCKIITVHEIHKVSKNQIFISGHFKDMLTASQLITQLVVFIHLK